MVERSRGRVVTESDRFVILGQRNGTLAFRKAEVREIKRGASAAKQAPFAKSQRLQPFADLLEVVAHQPWAPELLQVPATVIDIGELRNIPYISHKSGRIEFNVYGDPDHPAGVEIGIYDLNPDQATRESLRAFMVEAISNPYDRAELKGLGLENDSRQREVLRSLWIRQVLPIHAVAGGSPSTTGPRSTGHAPQPRR